MHKVSVITLFHLLLGLCLTYGLSACSHYGPGSKALLKAERVFDETSQMDADLLNQIPDTVSRERNFFDNPSPHDLSHSSRDGI